MKRIALLIYLTTLSIASAFAVPAKPGIMTRTQSDGSIVTFEIFGDEFSHYTLADGIYTVVEDNDGDFCYATIKDNALISSGVKVRSANKLSNEERSVALQSIGLRPTKNPNALFTREMHSPERSLANRIKSQAANFANTNESALEIADWGGEVKGERNLLVILVEYSDVFFSIGNPREKFDALLNEEGYSENGATGSARDYFMDSSSGTFKPNFDVAGPYRLNNKREFYGAPDKKGNDDSLPAVQIVDACDLAYADGVDFTRYDNDGDGKIDLVFVVYAGHNQAEGGHANTIWPHQWEIMPGINVTNKTQPDYSGKKLVSYACTSELKGYEGTKMSSIGTFCHEFGHAIGLPDWYDTSEGGAGFGLNCASIMDTGNYLNDSRTPPTHNIIERWLLGWAFPKEITETGHYEISHISNNDAYIVWANDNKTECFLFESRVAAAGCKWDKYLNEGDNTIGYGYEGGEGMLIYHLDWDKDVMEKWENHTINTDPGHQCAQLFRASPTATETGSRSWFYPGARRVTSLTYDGIPQFRNWDEQKLPFYFDNIMIVGDKVSMNAMIKELTYDARQYDILVDWMAAKADYSEWEVECIEAESGEVVYQKTTSNKFVNFTPLKPSTKYQVKIYGKGESVPTFELETTTQNPALIPMAALNVPATHKSSNYILLSVKNLDFTMDNIEWYIDGEKETETYIKLDAGNHQICAVITDTEGNTHYLYRQITVQ